MYRAADGVAADADAAPHYFAVDRACVVDIRHQQIAVSQVENERTGMMRETHN